MVTSWNPARLWPDRVVPRLVEVSLRGPDMDELRSQVCRDLHGRVLEIGFGSGLNVRHYPDEVTEVRAVEPNDVAWQLSARRRERTAVPVERAGLDGQRLAEPDGSCDSALVTFSLCTIPDPVLALREVARVLRPGGAVHFLEHGAAPEESVRRWQRRLEPVQRCVAGGCHLTRDVPHLLREAGFRVVGVEERYLMDPPPLARPWLYGYLGTASVPEGV